MFVNSLPPSSDGRTRYVCRQWLRDPNGELLTKPPPKGVRTPNDLIWGHDLHDFCWIERFPNISCMTIWSRSMIKEFGENYDESEFNHPDSLQVPRERHPWPVLKLPKKLETLVAAFDDSVHSEYGLIDEGCDKHAEPGYVPKRREDPEDAPPPATVQDIELAELIKRILGVTVTVGMFRRNDPENPVLDHKRRPYTFLWAPRFATLLPTLPRGVAGPLETVKTGPFTVLELDAAGVQVLATLDVDALEQLRVHNLPSPVSEEADTSTDIADDDDMAMTSAEEPTSPRKEDKGKGKARDDGEVPSEPEGGAMGVDEREVSDVTEEIKSAKAEEPLPMDQVPAKGKTPEDSPFSIKEIPKLEEFIPVEYFPDILSVHDPHSVTSVTEQAYGYTPPALATDPPILYQRVFPKLARDGLPDAFRLPSRVAHLHLAQQNRCGVGHHSLVHCAPLTLPEPLTAHSRNGRVRVAVKSAFPVKSARELLKNEAKIYNTFPKHMMQDWCGFNLVTPVKHPVPVAPVVPKFYGYYVPIEIVDGKVRLLDEIKGSRSPLLLLEECGEPVKPEDFTLDARSECYSMMRRLHLAGFIQGSFYVRNILVQPGPLTAPPEERSKETPSFRVIDFGRGEHWHFFVGDRSDETRVQNKRVEWRNDMDYEDKHAQKHLQIPDWNF